MKKISINGKPRVLMLYDFPIKGGGSGPYVKYLSLRLKEAYKYDIAIAAPDKQPIDESIKQYNLKLPQIPVFIGRPGLEKQKKYSELSQREIADLYYAFITETMKVIEEFRPDIIHVHHIIVNLWAARFIRSIYDIKFIVTSHGSCLHAISKDRRYFRMSRDALRAATMITVISGDTRAKLLKMFGEDLSKKTRTIPGGVRLSLFPQRKSAKELEALRESLKIGKEKVVLFTGRLISEKGVEYLVKAAKNIKGNIIIAGEGPQKNHLAELIKTLKVTNVTLLGHLEYNTLINLYYLADVFVSPAVWDEPLGLTIIEAMAAGKPVVITRKGGITVAVKDGYNGLYVRSRNSTDIAQKVNRLLENPQLAKKMGERARAVVVDKFTWSDIAERFDKVYKDVYFNR